MSKKPVTLNYHSIRRLVNHRADAKDVLQIRILVFFEGEMYNFLDNMTILIIFFRFYLLTFIDFYKKIMLYTINIAALYDFNIVFLKGLDLAWNLL